MTSLPSMNRKGKRWIAGRVQGRRKFRTAIKALIGCAAWASFPIVRQGGGPSPTVTPNPKLVRRWKKTHVWDRQRLDRSFLDCVGSRSSLLALRMEALQHERTTHICYVYVSSERGAVSIHVVHMDRDCTTLQISVCE